MNFAASVDRTKGHRVLEDEPRHRLAERLGAKQRTGRSARRDIIAGISALGKGTQAIFGNQQPGCREDSPLEQVSPCDLALGQRLDDFGPVVAGVLCLFQTDS